MGVNDGGDFTSRLQDVAMEAPFARRPPPAEPPALQIHQRNVLGDEGFVGHAGGTYEEGALIAAYADVARFAVGQAAARQLAAAADDGFAQRLVRHRSVRNAHEIAPRPG